MKCANDVNPFSPTHFFLIVAKRIYQSIHSDTGLTHPSYFFDTRALWRSVVGARVPECQKL